MNTNVATGYTMKIRNLRLITVSLLFGIMAIHGSSFALNAEPAGNSSNSGSDASIGGRRTRKTTEVPTDPTVFQERKKKITTNPAIPIGTGPGVHSSNSPFAPLQDRSDVLPWPVLTAIKTRVEQNRVLPVFTPAIMGLDQKIQRVQGYMMPLDPSKKQKHFLLSLVPLTCAFCVPGGPESMVEVRTKSPVRYSMEAVVVEGQFTVLKNDPDGIYYRMTDAVAVK